MKSSAWRCFAVGLLGSGRPDLLSAPAAGLLAWPLWPVVGALSPPCKLMYVGIIVDPALEAAWWPAWRISH